MPIPLKIWDKDDPEQGRLYTGLPVTLGGPQQEVLLQPQIPHRVERLAELERRSRSEEDA
jgi:hypothetical protein